VSDQFYRYKMPRLIAKVEGKGNGIKTVIVNMVDVAKALNRPPTYPMAQAEGGVTERILCVAECHRLYARCYYGTNDVR